MAPKIQIGSVLFAPEVKTVTMTSSKESANASSAPETRAVATVGSVTYSCVCHPRAPRSADASASEFGIRRSRAIRLLYTTTMQKVACPIMIVHSESLMPAKVKKEFSAIPVMMPGSASGRTSRNEIPSRPKNLNRCRP